MFKAFFKGFLLSGCLAGAYALLNAPAPGEVTRNRLKNYAQRVKTSGKQLKSDLTTAGEQVNQIKETGVTTLNEAVDDVQSRVKTFTKRITPQVNRLQANVEQLKDHLQAAKTQFSTTSTDEAE